MKDFPRPLIREMSLNGRIARLKLLAIKWLQNDVISDDIFDHQFKRIIKLYPDKDLGVNPISAEEMLKRIKSKT